MRKTEVTLVSSASSKEFTHLLALLESIKEWEPSHPVVVYDLGLEDSQKAEIQKMKVLGRGKGEGGKRWREGGGEEGFLYCYFYSFGCLLMSLPC